MENQFGSPIRVGQKMSRQSFIMPERSCFCTRWLTALRKRCRPMIEQITVTPTWKTLPSDRPATTRAVNLWIDLSFRFTAGLDITTEMPSRSSATSMPSSRWISCRSRRGVWPVARLPIPWRLFSNRGQPRMLSTICPQPVGCHA